MKGMKWPFGYHGMEPNVLVEVPSDKAVFDPRVVDTEAQVSNHSCSRNARIVEPEVHGKSLIFNAHFVKSRRVRKCS